MSGRNLVLIGFMGSGKSTIGRICAARMRCRFIDSDHEIERRTGCTIAELFEGEGEAAFRAREREMIAELSGMSSVVLATGGGAILDPVNVANLRAGGFVVLLDAQPEIIVRRIGNGRTRPLLAAANDPAALILKMMAERLPHYRAAAHCQVETTDKPPQSVAADVMRLYKAATSSLDRNENQDKSRTE